MSPVFYNVLEINACLSEAGSTGVAPGQLLIQMPKLIITGFWISYTPYVSTSIWLVNCIFLHPFKIFIESRDSHVASYRIANLRKRHVATLQWRENWLFWSIITFLKYVYPMGDKCHVTTTLWQISKTFLHQVVEGSCEQLLSKYHDFTAMISVLKLNLTFDCGFTQCIFDQ